jgi:serine/threonine protein kinase
MNLCLKCGRLYDAEIERCPQDGEELLPYEATVHDGEEVAGVVLGRALGIGPCGKIVDGIEVATGEHVVVRLLGEEMLRDRPAADGLRRHLLQAKAFGHPGMVHVRSITTQDDRVVVVRDVVEGERVEDLLARETALPVERALRIALQVCTVLAAAHRTGLLHLQVRASNVFLLPNVGKDEDVRLIDFGIGPLQRAGARWVYGVPHSLAPEQIDLKLQPSAKSDIFGVGLLLFHMLTGRTAYPRTGDLTQIVGQPLPPLCAPDGSAFPPALETFVKQMSDRKPPLRPSNMDVVIDRLRRLLPGGQTRPAKPPSERRLPARPLPSVMSPAVRPPPSAHLDDDEPEDVATIVMSETAMAAVIAEGMVLPSSTSQTPAAPQDEKSPPAKPAASAAAPKRTPSSRPAGVQPKVRAAKARHSVQWKFGVGVAAGVAVLAFLALLVPTLASGPASESTNVVTRAAAQADAAEASVAATDAPAGVRESIVNAVEVSQRRAEPDAAVEDVAPPAETDLEGDVPVAGLDADGGNGASDELLEAVEPADGPTVEQIAWYVRAGNRALAARRFDEAQEAYAGALSLDAEDRGARLGMGRTAAQQGRFDVAVTYLEPLLRERGSMELGMAYLRLDRIADAKQQFELVLARDPSNADAARALESISGRAAS